MGKKGIGMVKDRKRVGKVGKKWVRDGDRQKGSREC